jgi:hypothetical protein
MANQALIKLMMTSSVYRQASLEKTRRSGEGRPGNQLLWRMRIRRLESEAIRDSDS